MNKFFLVKFFLFCLIAFAQATNAAKYPVADIPEELLVNAKKVIRYSSIDVTCIDAGRSLIKKAEVVTYIEPSPADRFIVIHYQPSIKVKILGLKFLIRRENLLEKSEKKKLEAGVLLMVFRLQMMLELSTSI